MPKACSALCVRRGSLLVHINDITAPPQVMAAMSVGPVASAGPGKTSAIVGAFAMDADIVLQVAASIHPGKRVNLLRDVDSPRASVRCSSASKR